MCIPNTSLYFVICGDNTLNEEGRELTVKDGVEIVPNSVLLLVSDDESVDIEEESLDAPLHEINKVKHSMHTSFTPHF